MATDPAEPRVAVEPKGTRDWLRDSVEAGGGILVEPAEAEALVWTAPGLDEGETVDDATSLGELLAAHPSVGWVQLPWAGVELYRAAGLLDDQRVWTCGKGIYGPPVAEHALTLTLAGLRNLKRLATARSWRADAGVSLMGGGVTIFGGGGIARSLVSLLAPFDCRIQVVRRHDTPLAGTHLTMPFEQRYQALAGVDAVVLALPLTPETEGLIGDIELELMEPHAWLVNVARGRHVVVDDLVKALRDDAIGGAALDVTDPEPLPPGHPLWDLPNCLITSHVANTEDMAIPLLSQRVSANVARFAAGQPLLGRVDPELGY
ncbi:MAG: hydroxyacid dehydrogenase [Actinobacteria bacterium QS_5_72_10]|nr:MAG: hydroxyacid dehydrogenase [Actinobacteria bacterium QS_8_72_14]PSO54865.1 MAG: hydroxyacid dehydrogenase [Actinobacteria bacterium QS_5_72_10]